MIKKIVNLDFPNKQQHIVNMAAGIMNMLVTAAISIGLSPYIVKTIGVEANGFVSLANEFISYVTLIRTALNSMGSRFIMMAYYNNEREKVDKYYSSLFFADLVLGLIFGILGAICVWKLEYVLNIPPQLVTDVKILFALLFLNFVIATVITVWNVAPYIKNKLYLDSLTALFNSIIRVLVIIGLFMCLNPSVCYIGIGTLVGGFVGYTLRYFYKRYLFPDLVAKANNFSWRTIKELLASGVWNSVSSLGSILLSGMDLLVANLFIGPSPMGVLSVAKTMPSFVSTLNSTIGGVFTPSLIMYYARNELDEIVNTIRESSKMISVICSLPLGFLLVYGKEFYALWQPTQNAETIYILSVITIFGRVFFTGMEPLFNVFTVVNKVKQNSLVTILTGAVSIGMTFLLLQFTDLGIYAVAGVSVVCCFCKNTIFVIPFSAKYLGLPWKTFFFTLFPSVLCTGILLAWGTLEKILLPGKDWGGILVAGFVFCLVGLILTILIVLSKDERKKLIIRMLRKKG